jgi:hypothetical protein
MAHELFGERFLSRAVPAWHRLGKVYDKDAEITAVSAVDEIASDITIEKIPFVLPIGGVNVETDKSAIVRLETKDAAHEIFGTTSGNRYEVVQYSDLGQTLNPLSEVYPIETAGILKDGRFMFIGLRAESFEVKGVATEEVKNYVVVVMSQVPGTAHKIIHTPVRVVCQNTLSYGEKRSSLNLAIPHTAAAADVLSFATDVILNMKDRIATTKMIFDAMATIPLGKKGFEALLNAAYPMPVKPKNVSFFEANGVDLSTLADRKDDKLYARIARSHDAWNYRIAREASRRDAAKEALALINDEHKAIAGTVYAGYQAITEASDWREGKGDADYSTLLGPRADEKSRAYEAAYRMAGVSSN